MTGLKSAARKETREIFSPRAKGQLFLRDLRRTLGDIATITRQVTRRGDKVYLDYLQNRHGQTIVAPFSVRPLPGATVSMPLRWDEVNDSLDEVLDMVIRAGHSRVPVYDESLDNIVGVLYAKDLLPYLKSDGKSSEAIDVRTLVRPPVYVPETKAVDELLREMQVAKRHIAIVVDEYGGTAGLVTIEDIVEEIVGEIQDEYDIEESLVEPISGDDMVAFFEHAEDGIGGRHPRGEAVRVLAAFERGQVRFEHGARRIFRPRVFEAFVLAQLRLHVRRRLKNRIGDRAGDRLRLLAGVDAIGGETHSFPLRQSA